MKAGQRSRGKRRGNVFPVRMEPEVRIALEAACAADTGPKALGPWLLWRATCDRVGNTVPDVARAGITAPAADGSARAGITTPGKVIPELGAPALVLPVQKRVILDLCAGSGSWSEPYRAAGYQVRRVTLPALDVRVMPAPDETIWGVLAAPPCTEFSLAKNGHDRDFRAGLEGVAACLRIVTACAPRWWALENPVGLLSRFLGEPLDVWQPFDFGDPWSKRTALWGRFAKPVRGPRVRPIDGGGPLCVVCHPDSPKVCGVSDHRAVSPPGFARAFFNANE
jgi:hypothetical protein